MWRGGGGVGVRETVFGRYARGPFYVQRSPRHGHRSQERLPFTGLCLFVSVYVLPKHSASMFAPLPEHSFESRNSSFRGAKTLNHALEGSCVDKQPRKGQRKGGVA